jgi:hypothetical protein
MKRSWLIATVTTIHVGFALALAALAVFVLLQTRSTETLSEPDAKEAIYGLQMGSLALGVPALILFAAVYGLWKGKLWGWWLAFLIDVSVDGAFIYSVFEDGWRQAESEDVVLAICFASLPILLLLPRVFRFYWKRTNPQLASAKV